MRFDVNQLVGFQRSKSKGKEKKLNAPTPSLDLDPFLPSLIQLRLRYNERERRNRRYRCRLDLGGQVEGAKHVDEGGVEGLGEEAFCELFTYERE